jgi:hypothetical protein
VERLKRPFNGMAGNTPRGFLDGFAYRFSFNVERAEIPAECN